MANNTSAYSNRLSGGQPPVMLDRNPTRRIQTPATGFSNAPVAYQQIMSNPSFRNRYLKNKDGALDLTGSADQVSAEGVGAVYNPFGQPIANPDRGLILQRQGVQPTTSEGDLVGRFDTTSAESQNVVYNPFGQPIANPYRVEQVDPSQNLPEGRRDPTITEDLTTAQQTTAKGVIQQVMDASDEDIPQRKPAEDVTVQDTAKAVTSDAIEELEGPPVPTASQMQETQVAKEAKGLLSEYTGSKHVADSIADALINYGVTYAATGGDEMRALGSAAKVGTERYFDEKERATGEVAGELQRLGFSNAQVKRYIETGQMSPAMETMVSNSLKARMKGDKTLTEGQEKARTASFTMKQADAALENLNREYGQDYEASLVGFSGGFRQMGNEMLPQMLKSEEWKQYDNAASQWNEAALRRLSGATIKDEEIEKYREMYWIQPGDDVNTLQKKRRARKALETATQVAAQQLKEGDATALMNIIGSGEYSDVKRVTNPDGSAIMYLISADGKTQTPVRISK